MDKKIFSVKEGRINYMVKKKSGEVINKSWDKVLENFFVKKLPALPEGVKEALVKFGPWITLVALVLSLPTLLMALGLRSVYMSTAYGYHYGYSYYWWISIASMVLMAIALPGLFKRQLSAWKRMFYAVLVTAVYDLVTFSLGGLIIGTGISLYILYQIKSFYK